MANVWRVGPGIERCGFEFWQTLFYSVWELDVNCILKIIDMMEIEELKVNTELSQIRDSYV